MKIGGKAVLDEIEARHWGRFAANAQLSMPFVRARVGQLCDVVITARGDAFADGHWMASGFATVQGVVGERARLLGGKK